MAKEKTVTQMVDAIAKARGVKRDEAHDYMIKVAYGRLGALAAWRKANPDTKKPKAKKAKKGGKGSKLSTRVIRAKQHGKPASRKAVIGKRKPALKKLPSTTPDVAAVA